MTTAIANIDQQQARALTDRIKVAVEGTWLLIQDAYTSRAWAALGYNTWDAYIEAEFGTTRLALPREERAQTVLSMRQAGMSLRAISAATGVSPATVMRDARVSDETPSEITGIDGKPYAAAQPPRAVQRDEFAGHEWAEPEGDQDEPGMAETTPSIALAPSSEPAKPKRRPITEAFFDTLRDYTRASDRFQRLTQDDRFNRNRDQTHHYMPELLTALGQTAELLQAMNLPETTASEEARRWWATSLNTISDTLAGVANQLPKEQ